MIQLNGRTVFNNSDLNNPDIDGGSISDATITSIKTAVAADNTLSGTPIIITVYDAASNTPYYFKAYPTKQ